MWVVLSPETVEFSFSPLSLCLNLYAGGEVRGEEVIGIECFGEEAVGGREVLREGFWKKE